MKTDVEIPDDPPRKRRHLEDSNRTPDLFIATWLARDDLGMIGRERLLKEKERRKALKPLTILAVFVDRAGLTPRQRGHLIHAIIEVDDYYRMTLPSRAALDVLREDVTDVLCMPKETRRALGSPVWEAARYARHRKLPVKVILPNGEEWNELGN